MTARRSDTCERTRALLSRSLDCELPELQRTLLDTHTRRCASCAAFARELQWITSSLRTAPLELAEHPVTPPRRRRPVRLRVAVQAASFALVAVGVGTVVLPGGPVVDHRGEEALVASQLTDPQTSGDSIRELRGDAIRDGYIVVLPATGSDSIGEAKPALPAIPPA